MYTFKPLTVVARSVKGMKFMYDVQSAHQVSKASSRYICKVLNEHAYQLNRRNDYGKQSSNNNN